jgi:SAM-dependent methyltransferase
VADLVPCDGAYCVVCDSVAKGDRISVSEKMYGTGEVFSYVQCSNCGCLILCNPPANLDRYYPPDYYSQAVSHSGTLTRWLKRSRARAALGGSGLVGSVLLHLTGEPPVIRWIRPLGTDREARILDIGSGSGKILSELALAGFTDLVGIDPYAREDCRLEGGIRILRRELDAIEGGFDVVMLHHVLEHLRDPMTTLARAHSLLVPGGGVLIRTPVVGSFAWRKYREHWVQLDPPRHLIIYSVESLRTIAVRTGFEVVHSEFDSDAFQFWGSEQDQAGIPLRSPVSYASSPRRSLFRRAEIHAFEEQAVRLNATGEGDQICLYLRKI